MRAAGEKLSAFLFCNFVNFKSIGEKLCILLPPGGKICIYPPFLHPLAIILQTCYLAIFLPPPPGVGSKQKNTHDIKFENIHSIGRHAPAFFTTSHNSSNICNFSYLRSWNYRITKRRLGTDFFSLENLHTYMHVPLAIHGI